MIEGLGGDEVIPLSEAAALLHEHPASLYTRGIRGEFELVRLSPRAWGLRRWQLERLIAWQPAGAV